MIEAMLFQGVSRIASYIQTRTILLPNLLGFQYYDFFKDRELLYLRESIIGRLGFSKPYDHYTVNIISDIYYNNLEANANTGLCGDAFANFGWSSLIFYPLVIVLILKVLDKCTVNINAKPLMTICVLFSITFINASFFTLLLTNGYIFMCIFMLFYPKEKSVKKI